ncbi:hypothetical protein BMW22_29705 (plasmid) [Rhizobium leguminosarum]|uniref:PRTase-CE domain-containing protein n=1 Tax=Rhizobium leguminosarum TaxID=384 RepID=A0A1L3ZKL8_RHILE|nr:hypothetical protein BMW22_29705 [Rhizobium leguminosarum]
MVNKLKKLTETTWHGRILEPDINRWVSQFAKAPDIDTDEQLHALYLLGNFIYFGQTEIRELLKSLYRELFRTPAIHAIRRAHGDTTDWNLLETEFDKYQSTTRFLGVGNPSESGVHLLYYFRQENDLPRSLFIHSHQIFSRDTSASVPALRVRNEDIETYVFIDDLCGSGTQAAEYSQDIVEPLRKLKPDVKIHYLILFATADGLKAIRDLKQYDNVTAIYELDHSFSSLEPASRIFSHPDTPFDRAKVKATCEKYGSNLWAAHPLGYKNGQLLLGFNHNTPDNSLPIFWRETSTWRPIFKRYHKDPS